MLIRKTVTLLFLSLTFLNVTALKSNSADSLRTLGIKAKNQGQFSAALSYYHMADSIYQLSRDSTGLANINNNIGLAWYYLGDFKKCYESYEKSLRFFEMLDDENGIGKVNINLGNYYFYEKKDLNQALHCYGISQTIFKKLKNKYRLLVINNNIGSIFLAKDKANDDGKNYDSTKLYYQRGIQIAQELKKNLLQKDSLSSAEIAELHYLKNQVGGTLMNWGVLVENTYPDSTLIYYNQALRNFKETNNQYKIAGIYLNRGDFYLRHNKINESIKQNQFSLSLSSKNEYWDFIHGASKNLAQLYEQIGLYDSSTHYYKKYIEANDTVYNEIKVREIETLETRFETEKKDKEIQLQHAEIEITSAERDTFMYTLLISIGFTLIILLIYSQRQKAIKNLRQKESEVHLQKVNRLIQEQELKSINALLEGEERERKRIAEDLHDRVGSMLSAMRLQIDPSDEKVSMLLDETAEEVRRISHNLETRVLNRFGLVAALEDLADKINSSEKIKFELQHLDLDERLDNKVEINVYRMVQEIISNALKHSQAKEITAQINRINGQLIIIVEDNGIGFDTMVAKKMTGMGLKNIDKRVNELNGNLNIDSGKGGGTTVTIEIPL